MSNYSFAHPYDDDHLHEECGIFGVYDCNDAAAHTALGLHALQHRGQEGAGIVSCDYSYFHQYSALGKVGDTFNEKEVIEGLPGRAAIGHNRYSTSGKNRHTNIQPLFAEISHGGVAVAHNGNLTNAHKLRKELVGQGCIFRTTMDTEVVIHLIATSKGESVQECLVDALHKIEGAYSLIMLSKDGLYAVRDALGVRPMVLGKLGEGHVIASETCALDIIGAEYIRDVDAGEMVVIRKEGTLESHRPFKTQEKPRFCIFEYVYFSRPDSIVDSRSVYTSRKAMGTQLAKENAIEADVVVPVPDSGVPSAIGFSEESGIPFELGIIRNHYVGRTFIEPTDQVRHLGVKLKHNANLAVLKGKRVVLIDDSIVRGTTSKKIVDMVREAGAKEIHMLISSPPTTNPCFYGVDTPDKEQLLASKMTIDDMRKFIEADSLAFLSVDGMYRAVIDENRDNNAPQYCDACFTGEYPIAITDGDINNVTPLFDSLLIDRSKK